MNRGLCVIIIVLVISNITTVFWHKRKINRFATEFCGILDNMIAGNEITFSIEREQLIDKLNGKLKRLYEILRDKTEQSEAKKHKMQSLISDISHQVKTPIANTKMYCEILSQRRLSDDKRQEFLNLLHGQICKLDFLMQSMIKMSRLENGVIELHPESRTLYDTLAEALTQIVVRAERKQIDIVVECKEEVSAIHDKKWTIEALFNLLENAVKYSPEHSHIQIKVESQEFYTLICITDEGRGIKEAEQALIFQRFYRSQSVSNEDGIGIGLFLAREIISRQGGYIQVKSEVGSGSEFFVFLRRE